MTKEKILDAAVNQFSQHGYQGATMQKIASEVGIKPASIYFFYKNKEDVFTAAFQRLLERHLDHMKSVFSHVRHKPLVDIFRALIEGSITYHKENAYQTAAYVSLITSPPPKIRQYLHKHMKQFDEWLLVALTDSIKREIPNISTSQTTAITMQFVLLMDGIFWETLLYDADTLNQQLDYAQEIMHTIIGGMKFGS
ncbi:TetR/AcrR family transcriptional regulator [Lentibacillus saliphilus]|uniref:TetR/AcrR family transcriptional regulator n=1 Tax=Lentibacillus saliphilus TaxID=2737028 RepID=UPI001C2FD7D5|nr:TetR/AcrR family transcriptional regulator [Lentibacillus saliphilus]